MRDNCTEKEDRRERVRKSVEQWLMAGPALTIIIVDCLAMLYEAAEVAISNLE